MLWFFQRQGNIFILAETGRRQLDISAHLRFIFLIHSLVKSPSMTTPFLSDAMNPSAAGVIKIVHLTPYERFGVIVSRCSEIYDLAITFL